MTKASNIKYLAEEDIVNLVSTISSTRDRLILLILYETGCSITELTNIKLRDIKTNKKELIINHSVRTGEKRTTKISNRLSKTIKEFLKKTNQKNNSNHLFTTRQSSTITPKRVQQILGQYTIKKIKVTPQIIRYTHIAHAYKNGVSINEITKQVGLKRSRTIEIFSQLKSHGSTYDKFLEGLIKNA